MWNQTPVENQRCYTITPRQLLTQPLENDVVVSSLLADLNLTREVDCDYFICSNNYLS